MFQSDKKSSTLGTILGPEIEIDGDIIASGNMIIYGKINGNIQCSGDINTAKESIVNGIIQAKNIFISGSIKGDLNIENKIREAGRIPVERDTIYEDLQEFLVY